MESEHQQLENKIDDLSAEVQEINYKMDAIIKHLEVPFEEEEDQEDEEVEILDNQEETISSTKDVF